MPDHYFHLLLVADDGDAVFVTSRKARSLKDLFCAVGVFFILWIFYKCCFYVSAAAILLLVITGMPIIYVLSILFAAVLAVLSIGIARLLLLGVFLLTIKLAIASLLLLLAFVFKLELQRVPSTDGLRRWQLFPAVIDCV